MEKSNPGKTEMDPRMPLSVERTILALERTQLAWVRTLLSMIGGGFVIDKGFAVLHQARVESGQALVQHAHLGGLIITISGTLLMAAVTVSFVGRLGSLNEMKGAKRTFRAPAFILSLFTILLGIVLTYFIRFA